MIGIPKITNLHVHARALEFDWLIQKRLQIIHYKVKYVDIYSIGRLYRHLKIGVSKNASQHAHARVLEFDWLIQNPL